jgi:hypothetical protein
MEIHEMNEEQLKEIEAKLEEVKVARLEAKLARMNDLIGEVRALRAEIGYSKAALIAALFPPDETEKRGRRRKETSEELFGEECPADFGESEAQTETETEVEAKPKGRRAKKAE